jgi:hypothetical protein
MFFIRSRFRIMDDFVHGLCMVKLILCREMKWRLMNLSLLIMASLVGSIAGRDVLFGVQHVWCYLYDTVTCGAPSFEYRLVLSKIGDVAEGEDQTYLFFSDSAGKSGVTIKGRDVVGQSPELAQGCNPLLANDACLMRQKSSCAAHMILL